MPQYRVRFRDGHTVVVDASDPFEARRRASLHGQGRGGIPNDGVHRTNDGTPATPDSAARGQHASLRHPGDTGARDFMPERTFRVMFRNRVALTVQAKSVEEAKQKARAQYKDEWRKSFGTNAADVGIASVTTQG